MKSAGALDGIRIIDSTIYQLGPVATCMLADLGAEVIKIEKRDTGDPGRGIMPLLAIQYGFRGSGPNFYFDNCNRNKKSIALDLNQQRGREVVYRLVKKGDIFVQN